MIQQVGRIASGHARMGRRVLMMVDDLIKHQQPIQLIEQRFNFLPQRFRWRGMTRQVRRIVDTWERPARMWHAPRRYFLVICQDGNRYTLFQDLTLGTWHLSLGA